MSLGNAIFVVRGECVQWQLSWQGRSIDAETSSCAHQQKDCAGAENHRPEALMDIVLTCEPSRLNISGWPCYFPQIDLR